MEGIIRLSGHQCTSLLAGHRSGSKNRVSRRAQVALLLADGRSWREVRDVLFVSFDLISAVVKDFRKGCVEAVLGVLSRALKPPFWLSTVLKWLEFRTPRDFGFFRWRWTCGLLAETLAWEQDVRVSAETIRRWLAKVSFVWRRARPVVGLVDLEYRRNIAAIHELLRSLPARETAVFQVEVDVHLNPKIGSCGMRRGAQAEVITPGNNEKRHVGGSLHWRTGRLFVSPPGRRRDRQLFVEHLEHLRYSLRSYRVIHVICDNAKFHESRLVQAWLAKHGSRVRLHFLPKYAPETNPIERVWWHFHNDITRNHRCQSLPELLEQAYDWFHNSGSRYFEMNNIVRVAA